ncbi:MAG: hypothetical protein IJ654_03125 [Bacteroidales bacterium]|nr:hypothetical protein [Bacteroidales bacterium]
MMRKTVPVLLVLLLTAACTKVIENTIEKTVYEIRQVEVPSEDGPTALAYSIQSFQVLPTNAPAVNKVRLQQAIDWASSRGASLYIEPVEGGYPIQSGIVLKKNVSLVGAHGPTGRGTVYNGAPTGSVFVITDTGAPFLTVQSASQVKGIQFYYPDQAYDDPAKVIEYPPTIRVSQDQAVNGVTLSCLTFYGTTFAMDFRAQKDHPCEQILFEHCYGYPLGGQFIAIDYCYDIPRILHCHVNPAVMREFKGDYPKAMNDHVIRQRKYTYWINHTDNAQVIDVFTFGNYGGIYLGASTYGQMTNFNFDCVCNGVFKDGDTPFNRIWEVAQGSIIANTSPERKLEEIHPFLVQGRGQISIANVDAFSGDNPVLTNEGQSYDFLKAQGSEWVIITAVNCRMRNYACDSPVTLANPEAQISFLNCSDKGGYLYSYVHDTHAN